MTQKKNQEEEFVCGGINMFRRLKADIQKFTKEKEEKEAKDQKG